jgi:hypothetical protein
MLGKRMPRDSIFSRTLGSHRQSMFSRLFECAWWSDLLQHWRPSGSDSGNDGLRLTIRDGYMSFYRHGQSVAKVSVGRRSGPMLKIHLKYVVGSPTAKPGEQQHYVTLSQGGLLSCTGYVGTLGKYESRSDMLDDWIGRAGDQSRKGMGKEKVYVDKIVARNSGVIDLEMGLPGFGPDKNGKLVAPRMDIVALEDHRGDSKLVFWEAKMMDNGELRASRGLPRVCGQLQNYKSWMGNALRASQVAKAYKEHCEILLEIHDMAINRGLRIPDLGNDVMNVAKSTTLPSLDIDPRLVIFDFEQNQSWEAHGAKLRRNGVKFKVVKSDTPEQFLLAQTLS